MSSGDVHEPASLGDPAADPSVEPAAEPAAAAEPAPAEAAPTRRGRRSRRSENMLPGRERRRFGLERVLVRLVATCGIVGIAVAIGAILADNKVQGWVIGLVIGLVSVVLSGILWSSRQL